jgi:MFS family permease
MWISTLTVPQRRALVAAMLGWMFDSMDFLIYVLAIGRLKTYFGFGDATAGLLGTFTLISAAVGGLTFGVIADRIGRVRTLNLTIAIFSICSVGAATSQNVVQLAIWRTLLGLGMGGEWAAGGVLVAETLPAELRNKATSVMQSTWALGAILAAALSGLILDVLPLGPNAWRWLFAVGGLPALLILWFRRTVAEPEVWKTASKTRATGNPYRVLFGSELRMRTILACVMASLLQFAYWGFFFWLPNLLATPVERGGAGMSVVKSVGYLIPMQCGAFIGYLSFGPLADRFGRRRVFASFLAGCGGVGSALRTNGSQPHGVACHQSVDRFRGPRVLERDLAVSLGALPHERSRERTGAGIQLRSLAWRARSIRYRERWPRSRALGSSRRCW